MPSSISARNIFLQKPASKSPNIPASRLAIVDSNRTKAELLLYFCLNYWAFDVVAFESTIDAGLSAIAETKPELILAAVNVSDSTILEFIAKLANIAPTAKLILLTAQCSEYLVHLLGATHYHGLVWEVEAGLLALGQMIERALLGARTASAGISSCQTTLRASPSSFPKLLSKRQMEVLVCIGHSMTDEEIGQQLGCSGATALCHRQKIMRKLNIHSTPKLIRYCRDKGFGSVAPPAKVIAAWNDLKHIPSLGAPL